MQTIDPLVKITYAINSQYHTNVKEKYVHIATTMFSCIAGGIEQAFVDYCEGLQQRGHRVTAITHPNALINASLHKIGITPVTIRNFGEWDVVAVRTLRRLFQALDPDVIVSHTHRSYILSQRANKGVKPLVGTAHNYNKRAIRMANADGVLATTHDLMDFMKQNGVPSERIFHIPNMVRCHELPVRRIRQQPPVIGSLGRLVTKKGFDIYIDALAQLKACGYTFTAILGGEGVENNRLQKRARNAGLQDILQFPGWIEDKKAFYGGLDIFCLPSLHEPFGIVLLEAFTYGTPVVSSASEGPRDIITPDCDALLVPVGDATALADAMARLLDDAQLADKLAANGFAKAKTMYSMESIAARIEKALETVIALPPHL
jgi:glycosyltransferase involved in cell wall biosynthesis